MSLIWPAPPDAVVTDEPRLHAFIIGVGDYPHLMGGTGKLAKDPLGLSQVTTPRYTAPAIADWLINQHHNPDCPLGSVELLCSPGGPSMVANAAVGNVDTAIKANIDAAFDAWYQRAHAHAENISLFYFCGHGLSKSGQFLLPEDFGDPNKIKLWSHCIDFDGMRVGMRKCQAKTQLYFIDACRETPFGMLDNINVSGDPLVDGATFSDTVENCAVYFATTETRQAFGPDDGITFFGQALLSCLNGVGAINRFGEWVVNTYSLGNALGQIMGPLAQLHKQPLACNPNVSGNAFPLHKPPAARVLASVECRTPAASKAADILMSRGALVFQSAPGQPKPIIEEVEVGDWQITVQFPNNEFVAPAPQIWPLSPPLFEGVPVP